MFDRVLVQKAAAKKTTASGIILPESTKVGAPQGTVLAVGAGRTTIDGKLVPMTLKVGDKVVLPEYGGAEVNFEGEEAIIYREDEIVAILKN